MDNIDRIVYNDRQMKDFLKICPLEKIKKLVLVELENALIED